MNRHLIFHKRYIEKKNYIYHYSYCQECITIISRITSHLRHEPLACQWIYQICTRIRVHIPRACVSRISFRSDIHVEHTQLLNRRSIAENESSLRRSLSLRALACTFPRMDACIRNAGETSRRRRALQGDLTWIPWVLINSRGSISRVTKFHLSDSTRERMHDARIVIMRVNTRVYHPQSLILRIMDVASRWRR